MKNNHTDRNSTKNGLKIKKTEEVICSSIVIKFQICSDDIIKRNELLCFVCIFFIIFFKLFSNFVFLCVILISHTQKVSAEIFFISLKLNLIFLRVISILIRETVMANNNLIAKSAMSFFITLYYKVDLYKVLSSEFLCVRSKGRWGSVQLSFLRSM